MKKLVLIIALLLLTAGSTFAYDSINRGYVVLKTGLSGFLVEPQTEDGWASYFISIKGENLGELKTENATIIHDSGSEIRLQPKDDYLVSENDYEVWKITGTYDDQFFFIGGLTLEGYLLKNRIVPHTAGLFVGLLVLLFAKMVWLNNKGTRG